MIEEDKPAQSRPVTAQTSLATSGSEPSAAGWYVEDWGSPDYLDGVLAQYAVRSADDRPIAYAFEADEAQRLAAAPDLYEALKEVRDRLQGFVGALALSTDCSGDVDALVRADAALARADSRQ